jgi:hypothetical protein
MYIKGEREECALMERGECIKGGAREAHRHEECMR